MLAHGPARSRSMDSADQLDAVYEALVFWADIVLIASTPSAVGVVPVRSTSVMAERLNGSGIQITIHDRVLIRQQGRRFHRDRRARQRPGGSWPDADVLWRAWLRLSAVSIISPTVLAGLPRTWRTMLQRFGPAPNFAGSKHGLVDRYVELAGRLVAARRSAGPDRARWPQGPVTSIRSNCSNLGQSAPPHAS